MSDLRGEAVALGSARRAERRGWALNRCGSGCGPSQPGHRRRECRTAVIIRRAGDGPCHLCTKRSWVPAFWYLTPASDPRETGCPGRSSDNAGPLASATIESGTSARSAFGPAYPQ